VARITKRAQKAAAKAEQDLKKQFETADARVADSFQNFALQVGLGTDNAMSASTYGFNPISRNRILLEWIHRGSWIGGLAVDLFADDMTRGGIDIQSSVPPENIENLQRAFVRCKIWQAMNETVKWARLYGGAIAVFLIDGQDPATPLRVETVAKGQFKGLCVFDRWMVQPSLENLVTDIGPEIGMPKFYTVVADAPALMRAKIHHSRVIRLDGIKLPYWQRISENLWGISVLERLYDRLVAFDSASSGMAQAMHKMHLRIIKLNGLRKLIAAGGPAYQAVLQQVSMMRRFQTNEGITILDGEDEYVPNQINIGEGFSSALIQFGQQISGALQIPLVRLFGQSPAGLNSTGESDLRTYYDGIWESQENDLRVPLTKICRMIAQSEGIALPDEFDFKFKPLWQLKDTEKSDIDAKDTATVLDAHERGIIDHATALKEMRERGRKIGYWDNITDELIKQAEENPAPSAAEMQEQGNGLPGAPAAQGGEGGAKAEPDLLPKERLTSAIPQKSGAE
jgi:phage-related protein (TIGR01555 family)